MKLDFHGLQIKNFWKTDISGTFEESEMRAAKSLFAPGDRCIVAGAGMGWLAAYIAMIIGVENVIGIEANEHLANIVPQNVQIDGNSLKVLYDALSISGMACDLIKNKNWAMASVVKNKAGLVPGISIASLISQGYDCLALDIEGGEKDIITIEIAGMLRKAIIEVHASLIGKAGVRSVIKALESGGLTIRGQRPRRDEIIILAERL